MLQAVILIDKHDKSFNFSRLKTVHLFIMQIQKRASVVTTKAWDLIPLIDNGD